MKRIKYLVKNLKTEKVEKLKDRLKREKNEQFYSCDERCIRLDFEQSTNFEFKCPECGKLLNLEDNTDKIKNIEKEIKELTKELKYEEQL